MTVGKQVRALRLKAGMKRKDLSAATGVPTCTICRCELDKGTSVYTLKKLERVLGKIDIPDWMPKYTGKNLRYGSVIEEPEITRLKRWVFAPNKKYVIEGTKLRFLRKVGVNHLFQSGRGWMTCWTDAQLVGAAVEGIG